MEYKKKNNFYRNVLAGPFVWAVLFPLLLLDLFMEVYHRICFPLYGLTLVNRSSYIKIDRHKLQYLKWWEKLGCVYCGYANGLLRYCSAIAAETERYWCGIKHASDPKFKHPEHHQEFMEFGDKSSYLQLEEDYQKLWKSGKKEQDDS